MFKIIEGSGIDFELRYTIWHTNIKKISTFLKKFCLKGNPNSIYRNLLKQ